MREGRQFPPTGSGGMGSKAKLKTVNIFLQEGVTGGKYGNEINFNLTAVLKKYFVLNLICHSAFQSLTNTLYITKINHTIPTTKYKILQ